MRLTSPRSISSLTEGQIRRPKRITVENRQLLVTAKLEIPADWHLLDRLCFHAMAASMNATEAKWCGRPKRTDHSTYQFLTVASLFLDTSSTDQFFSAGASLTALHATMPSLVQNVQEEANYNAC